MDKLKRTLAVYETESERFIEQYQRESVAARFGDEFFDGLTGDRILDVGCGPGVDTETFVKAGFEVTGLDSTASFLENARKSVEGGRFVSGDMRALPFHPSSFDGIWACAAFLHVPRTDATDTLREFQRVLATDGVLYLSVRQGAGSHEREDGRYAECYQPEELERRMEMAGFGTVDASTTNGWIRVFARTE